MAPLIYTTSASESDLQGIIELQKSNLHDNLSLEERADQGFLMASHRPQDLKRMNDIEQHVICKDSEKVVAYVLAMTAKSQNDLPILVPMFDAFKKIAHKGRPVSDYNYIVVGQVCVDKNYRGQGIFDRCYEEFKQRFKGRYDFAITEIASRNLRSGNAHKRIGFSEVHRYISPTMEEWDIVLLEW